MTGSDRGPTAVPIRRVPPRFRRVAVQRTELLGSRLMRVTLAGADLDGFTVDEPAASVRLLLPEPGEHEVPGVVWNGNEFRLPDGGRPTLRTFTPRRADALEVAIDVVLHGRGAASTWAEECASGDPAALSGPGRGYTIDALAPAFFLAGDESAIPAISQLLEALPRDRPVHVHIEAEHPYARVRLPEHPRADVEWRDRTIGSAPGDELVEAVAQADLVAGTRIWVAGEAAGVQRVRRLLFEERRWPRSQASVRGYWKHGRRGEP